MKLKLKCTLNYYHHYNNVDIFLADHKLERILDVQRFKGNFGETFSAIKRDRKRLK